MSIIEQAEIEMRLLKIEEGDIGVMLRIMRMFFDQWDSGGAVSVMAPVLQRLIAGKPLSPLTGADSEWLDHSDKSSAPVFQNRRCGSVFKEKDDAGAWIAYDIDRPPNPAIAANAVLRHRHARHAITFPYIPRGAEVRSPVVEFRDRIDDPAEDVSR